AARGAGRGGGARGRTRGRRGGGAAGEDAGATRAGGVGDRGAAADRPGRRERRGRARVRPEREARAGDVPPEGRQAEVHPRHGDVKRLARAALAVALALVAVVLLTMGWQTSLIFPAPPRAREPAYPENLVKTPEATFLYFEGKRVVVWFHGNGEDLADAVPMVSLLRTLGVGVLAVEYPGYGVAGGTPSEQGAYAAAESALSWLRTERGVDDARVVLLGQSLGSGVATEMARRGHGARLVLISPFTSVAGMARRLFPFFPARFVRHR